MTRRILYGLFLTMVIVGLLLLAGALTREWEFQRLFARGEQAMASDQTFLAVEAFSGAIALKGDSMIAFLKRGETYRRRGEIDASLRDVRTASRLDPRAVRPAELLGDLNYSMERYGRAIESYQACVELDERLPRVWYKLGLSQYRAGNRQAAIDALRRAVGVDDRLAEAHYLLGVCLREGGKSQDAVAALQQAVRLAPELLPAREELVSIYRSLGQEREIIEQLEALARLDPTRSDRQEVLALAYARSGRTDLAVGLLGRATEQYPDNTGIYLTLGRVWLESAEPRRDRVALSKAFEALEPLARRTAPSSEALALYGRALMLSGDWVRAEQVLTQASATLPVDLSTLQDLAAAAGRLGHIGRAREAWERWTALAPESHRGLAAAYEMVGELSMRLGEARPAAAAFKKATQVGPPKAQTYERLAEAELASGNIEAARSAVTEGLGRDPASPALLAFRRRLK
jgi:tetratricopeptide (TPR) repeat protein